MTPTTSCPSSFVRISRSAVLGLLVMVVGTTTLPTPTTAWTATAAAAAVATTAAEQHWPLRLPRRQLLLGPQTSTRTTITCRRRRHCRRHCRRRYFQRQPPSTTAAITATTTTTLFMSSTALSSSSSVDDENNKAVEDTTTDNENNNDNNMTNKTKKKKMRKRLFLMWIHAVSILVIVSYYPGLLPRLLPALFEDPTIDLSRLFDSVMPLKYWNLVHGLSAMVFGGTILTTTVLEWSFGGGSSKDSTSSTGNEDMSTMNIDQHTQQQQQQQQQQQRPQSLWSLEGALVLPAVTTSLMSGLAQASLTYGGMATSPTFVKASLHTLLLFAVWWAVTDKLTQRKLVTIQENNNHDQGDNNYNDTSTYNNKLWKIRRISNVVSCGFVLALYAIMTLKPFI